MQTENSPFSVSVEAETGTGRLLSAYLRVREGRSVAVREYADGNVFADFDKDGNLLGIEVLGPCDAKTIERIAKRAAVKNFVRSAMPAGMLVTA